MAKMKVDEFIRKLRQAAESKTLYVMGCFGAPMTAANKTRYKNNHTYNKAAARQKMIDAASADTFGFDCVNLIKGILWGWTGDASKTYGGAYYNSNDVPDYSANQFFSQCCKSCAWEDIKPGYAVWMDGHIGVYVGNGAVIECTPKWKNCVQITQCNNVMGQDDGVYPGRYWKKCGAISYVDYTAETTADPGKSEEPSSWAREAWEWCKSCGITDGTRPLDTITRQEVMQLIYNILKLRKGADDWWNS